MAKILISSGAGPWKAPEAQEEVQGSTYLGTGWEAPAEGAALPGTT